MVAAQPTVRFLIVGDGDLWRRSRQQARALGLGDRVLFAGHRADVPDLLGAIDVLAIPSLYEGTPARPLRGHGRGQGHRGHRGRRLRRGPRATAPPRCSSLLATRTPSRRRSLPFSPTSAERDRLSAAARAASRRYDIATCVAQMQDLYDEVLAERGGAAVPLRKLAASRRRGLEVPRDLLLGRYPDFVTGGPLPRGDVPVFVFHSVEPESFGRKLRHLADNGYVTLSAEEYHQGLLGDASLSRARRCSSPSTTGAAASGAWAGRCCAATA